jgi:RHS repeat-associated protein
MELKLTTDGPGSGTVNATRYYSHGGAPVAVRNTAGLYWVHNDGQASAEIAVNATDGSATKRRYLPFGGDRSLAGTIAAWPSERGFLNKTKDSSTGLTHLGAREYDATNGRFLTPDPLTSLTKPQSLNAYAYAANNRIAYSDPSGLMMCDECGGGGGGSIGGGGSAPTSSKPQPKPSPKHKHTKRSRGWTMVAAVACGVVGTSGCASHGGPDGIYDEMDAGSVIFFGKYLTGGIASPDERWQLGRDASAGYFDAFWDIALMTQVGAVIAGDRRHASQVVADAVGVKNRVNYNSGGYRFGGVAADVVSVALTLGEGTAAAVAGRAATRAAAAGERAAARASTLETRVPVGCSSFVPGTAVRMANGSDKPIQTIRPGDTVLATDPETGHTGPRKVDATIRSQGTKTLVQITVDTDGPTGHKTGTLTATDKHPFWVANKHRWINAAHLTAGDLLLTSTGRRLPVTTTHTRTQPHRVHNLTIHHTHTYYVIAGTTPVLVHNCGGARFAVDSNGVATDLDSNPLRGTQYTDKVKAQIESGDDHGFPALIDELPTWRDTTVETGRDGNPYTHVRLPGDRGGSPGVYHWIFDEDGMINHRQFERLR